MNSKAIKRFRDTVYRYHRTHYRPMPWRETTDPYRILVSEIMLQQTQVPRVLEKYPSFIRLFPTLKKLAAAPLGDVVAAWQGLGYNRRALALKRLAAEVVARCGGELPADPDALERLPGIGKATAGAIMAYAFNKPSVYIETNIRSVYIHHFFRDRAGVADEELLPFIEKTLDRRNPRRWFNALMDYGVYLKSVHPNPSRRSRHYARQSRFEGSDRQLRGRIVRVLSQERRVSRRTLYRAIGGDEARLHAVTAALAAEGLIKTSKTGFSL